MEKVTYRSVNKYYRQRFGCKVYKVSLNGGFTCPNRDGTLGTKGCIFCSRGGSGEFAASANLPIKEQLSEGKELVKKKLPKEEVKFIAYFQAFTNTYDKVENLRKKYLEAVNDSEVVAISIATRPDCLPDEVISLLKEINAVKPVFVELGLQTIHERTASYINRGYNLSVFDEAVRRLCEADIEVICHVILGLPGETKQDMIETVKYVAESGAKGIKLQLLHVLKDTELYEDYLDNKFNVLNKEEYIDLLVECLKVLPEDMVVHRLTGDGDKKLLVAPKWSEDKKSVLNELNKRTFPV